MNIEVFSNINIPNHIYKTIEEEVSKRPLYFNESTSSATSLYWFYDFEWNGYWVECSGYSQEDDTLCVRANPTWFLFRECEL